MTRFAAGRKNALRIELNGELGSVAFDLERLNELEFHDHAGDPLTAGFTRILVTEPGHPYLSGWWPPGHVLGWDVTFTHEVADLVTAIAAGHRAAAVLRRRPAGPAGPGGRAGKRGQRQQVDHRSDSR